MWVQSDMHRMKSNWDSSVERRGFLLVIVMVVIVMASLTCYQFADRMTTERQVVNVYKMESQAQQAAESAIDYMMAMLTDPEMDLSTLPTLPAEDYAWQIILPGSPDLESPNDLMAVVLSRQSTVQYGELTFGFASEAGKINLNALAELDVPLEDQRNMLMSLPEMTETLADTILDFIDKDATPRDFGTESDDGEIIIRNAPLTSLDELLVIPEITPSLIYGEDTNRNGLLDSSEDDGELREPYDDADGVLTLGWEDSLTLWSRETNLRPDGTPKINLNSDDLVQLEADLTSEFGSDLATFVIAYRQNGPKKQSSTSSGGSGSGSGGSGSGNGSMNSQPAPQSGSGRTRGGGSTNQQQTTPAPAPAAPTSQLDSLLPDWNLTKLFTVQAMQSSPSSQNGGGASSAGSSTGSSSNSGQYQLQSPYELIGAIVEDDGDDLISPWQVGDLTFLAQMEESLTINEGETRDGRIDMNYATYESLAGLPEISDALIDEILSGTGSWVSPAELLQNGQIDVAGVVQLEPFLTAQSRTYRFIAAGFWKTGGPVVRIEVVLDVAGAAPVILQHRNLTATGPGYLPEELSGGFVGE
ncbi:General secretion pathway protein K [Rubinisphaera italica]|uniref:General secretion pathway protein K n=2 Tax=Rubinisphaera italica TaxID=2527969 RepID=A0A5C5XKN7_9PLAN|nr:General secretion pathway protein K [Rubinisphaera italica]